MGNPFISPTVSNYNSNPPADDGTVNEANRVTWASPKIKLTDPLKTALESTITNTTAAFGKIVGGAGVTAVSDDYEVQATDQGKLVRCTVSGKTITTPDAVSVGSPFVFAYFNASGASITLEGNDPGTAQNIDGATSQTIQAGQGGFLFTNGTDWFSIGGYNSILSGAQVGQGAIINGTIVESNATNAATFAIKTLAGNDPSTTDPVLVAFRNATAATGNYVFRTITAAASLVISSGSTLGTTSGVACRIWLVLFDDAGTVRIGAINCLNGKSIFPLGAFPIASSTAEGGAGAADSAHVFYTGTAVTSKPYLILGYGSYESGVGTAGSWNVSPTRLQVYDGGKLPGDVIQEQATFTGTSATGSTAIVVDDTIPQKTEGDEYMTLAITPSSAANLLDAEAQVCVANGTASAYAALFQDSVSDALAVAGVGGPSGSLGTSLRLRWRFLSATTSSTTLKVRAGASNPSNFTFNGSGGSSLFGGVFNSHMTVKEIMA